MLLFFELSNVIVETLLVLYYLQCIYSSSNFTKIRTAFAFMLYGLGLAIISVCPTSAFIRLSYAMVSMVILCIFVYRSRILNAIYAALAFNIMVILADVFCIIILGALGYSIESIDLGGSGRVTSIVVAKLVVLIGIHILTHLIHRNNNGFPRWTLPLIIGQGVSIVIASMALHIAMVETGNDFFVVFIGLGLLYLNLIICFYGESLKTSYENKHRTELAEQQLQLQVDYYQKAQKEQDATRALWHDIHKYLFSIYDLIESGNSTEAKECFKQAEVAIERIHKTVNVGNAVINGILDRATEQIQQTNIELLFDVWVPEKINIAAVDLYIILGNTLDNAIEACVKLENPAITPCIRFILKQHEHFLYYEILNPFSGELKKKNSKFHGYGLMNVRKCVEKYDGTMDVKYDEHEYQVVVKVPVSSIST